MLRCHFLSVFASKTSQKVAISSAQDTKMSASFVDPTKKRRLDEDGTAATVEQAADTRKRKLEEWLKPLNNESWTCFVRC
ncbi:unnamed protein product [Discosporangium mesarthrocarpum]